MGLFYFRVVNLDRCPMRMAVSERLKLNLKKIIIIILKKIARFQYKIRQYEKCKDRTTAMA